MVFSRAGGQRGKWQPPLPPAPCWQLVAWAHRARARGTAAGMQQRADRGTSAGGGPVPTFSFHLSLPLPFGSSRPSFLSASASSSLKDQNPSKSSRHAAQQQPSVGGDMCLAWTSKDQIPSTAGHGHCSLSKHLRADAFLHCPASFSLSAEDTISPGKELNNLSPASTKHRSP